jgi:hypothetical protein
MQVTQKNIMKTMKEHFITEMEKADKNYSKANW